MIVNKLPNKDKIEFSLLDFGLRSPKLNSLKIIEDVIEYAQMADQMGFKRIWLTEHHISDSLAAWYNPLPVITLIAGMTQNIITGIAGSQLSIHNPYHIATNYKMLANLFPNRIDLGMATGSVSQNLLEIIGPQFYSLAEKRELLIKLLTEEDRLVNEDEVIIPPYKGDIPKLWLLTSNYNRLDEVISKQLCFSRSLFHGGDLNHYKDQLTIFKDSFLLKNKKMPEMTLSFCGCCHVTDKKAENVAASSNYRGISSINITGSIERFKDQILQYQEFYGFNEFTFLNMARAPKDRRIALELIQKAFY